MYREHFGLRQALLGKDSIELWDDGAHAPLRERFQWLLQSPGLGVLTGEPGVGKTSVLRALTHTLNPHRHQVVYLPETDFGRLDLYRSLALALGISPPPHRRARLWHELKARILELTDNQQILPIWIVDEAHNLPLEFFRDLPAFLNFAFDSRDLLTVWLVGQPSLAQTLQRVPYAALAGRVQVRIHLKPILERERFAQFIQHAFKSAGLTQTVLADSGLELVRQASQGLPRQAGRILRTAMQIAAGKKLNHLPDEILQRAIEDLR
jgi:type II secretory pathway predicted ATPase ExeA